MKGIYTFLENMAISEVKELYTPSLKLGVSQRHMVLMLCQMSLFYSLGLLGLISLVL